VDARSAGRSTYIRASECSRRLGGGKPTGRGVGCTRCEQCTEGWDGDARGFVNFPRYLHARVQRYSAHVAAKSTNPFSFHVRPTEQRTVKSHIEEYTRRRAEMSCVSCFKCKST
jgi:hypothetical protein